MPKVSEEHRTQMRLRIQQAALRCVARKGLAYVSMNDIIQESGLSAGAIYGYYASKDELILAVANEFVGQRFGVLDELQAQTPLLHPALALERLVGSIPEQLSAGGVVVQIWGLAPVEPNISDITREWIAVFTARVADYTAAWLRQEGLSPAAARAKAKRLAPALIGLAQGYFVRTALGGPGEREVYAKSLGVLAELMTV